MRGKGIDCSSSLADELLFPAPAWGSFFRLKLHAVWLGGTGFSAFFAEPFENRQRMRYSDASEDKAGLAAQTSISVSRRPTMLVGTSGS